MFALFFGVTHVQVSITLTEAGQTNWVAVGSLVFAYIALVRRAVADAASMSVLQELWREVRSVSQIRYQFEQKSRPYMYVNTLARRMHLYSAHKVLSAGKLLSATLPGNLSSVVGCLSVDTCMVNLVRPDTLGDLSSGMGANTTPHVEWSYHVDYVTGTLPTEATQAWKAAQTQGTGMGLALPSPNVFIADDFALVAQANAEEPTKLCSNDGGTLWHRVDTSFKQPRAYMHALIVCPALIHAPGLCITSCVCVCVCACVCVCIAWKCQRPPCLQPPSLIQAPAGREASYRLLAVLQQQELGLLRRAASVCDHCSACLHCRCCVQTSGGCWSV